MSAQDLNYFQVDCKRKAEQVAMLQSMRQTRDQQGFAALENMFTPWKAITDPQAYQVRQDVGSGNINKQINYNLFLLSYCP